MTEFRGSPPEELAAYLLEEYSVEGAQLIGEPYTTTDKVVSAFEPADDDERYQGDLLLVVETDDAIALSSHIDAADVVTAGNGDRLKGILRIMSYYGSHTPDEVFHSPEVW